MYQRRFLPHKIKKLETRNFTLMKSTEVISDQKHSRNGDKVKAQFKTVLTKNTDIKVLIQLDIALDRETGVTTELDPALLVVLKFCHLS